MYNQKFIIFVVFLDYIGVYIFLRSCYQYKRYAPIVISSIVKTIYSLSTIELIYRISLFGVIVFNRLSSQVFLNNSQSLIIIIIVNIIFATIVFIIEVHMIYNY